MSEIGREILEGLKEFRDELATIDHPPQRFRWKKRGFVRWNFGCCLYMMAFDRWSIETFGLCSVFSFENCPWEIMGHVIGDYSVFEWLDNDLNWPSDPAESKAKIIDTGL